MKVSRTPIETLKYLKKIISKILKLITMKLYLFHLMVLPIVKKQKKLDQIQTHNHHSRKREGQD